MPCPEIQNPHPWKRRVRHPRLSQRPRLLLILLVDLADAALLVKDQIEHLVLAKKNSAKLLFLHEGDGLKLDHFEDG